MSIPTLVLDTNVLVSAFRSSLGASHRLVQLVDQGLFQVALTTPLVLEYEAVCKRLVGTTQVTIEDVDVLLDYLCRIGKRSIVHYRVRPMLSDPDDEMILEAAIASGSEWIVTHNVRDFAVGSSLHGIEILKPAVALRRLGVSQ